MSSDDLLGGFSIFMSEAAQPILSWRVHELGSEGCEEDVGAGSTPFGGLLDPALELFGILPMDDDTPAHLLKVFDGCTVGNPTPNAILLDFYYY